MRGLHLLLAMGASTAALAGPYDQPYALVETGPASEVRKEATVAISKVDDASTRNPRRSDPIPPGVHRITVHFQSGRGKFRDEFQVLELDLAACTRYRVVAQYQSRTGGTWQPKVYSEPIGECVSKFGKRAPPR